MSHKHVCNRYIQLHDRLICMGYTREAVVNIPYKSDVNNESYLNERTFLTKKNYLMHGTKSQKNLARLFILFGKIVFLILRSFPIEFYDRDNREKV